MDCFFRLFADGFFEEADFGPRLVSLFAGLFSAEAWGCQGGMDRIGWRYRLIGGRQNAMPGRFCGDGRRCAATHTGTLLTGVVPGSANLEKTGCFMVMTGNKWRVFQCTVNWARARPKTTLIAGVVAGSSSKCSV